MLGYWVSKLVNIFDIPHAFLIPLLSDGKKLYFQEIINDEITNFIETTEAFFESSKIISVNKYQWKRYAIGGKAVYAIQVNPNEWKIGPSQELVDYYTMHVNNVPKDCSLYKEMFHFINSLSKKDHTKAIKNKITKHYLWADVQRNVIEREKGLFNEWVSTNTDYLSDNNAVNPFANLNSLLCFVQQLSDYQLYKEFNINKSRITIQSQRQNTSILPVMFFIESQEQLHNSIIEQFFYNHSVRRNDVISLFFSRMTNQSYFDFYPIDIRADYNRSWYYGMEWSFLKNMLSEEADLVFLLTDSFSSTLEQRIESHEKNRFIRDNSYDCVIDFHGGAVFSNIRYKKTTQNIFAFREHVIGHMMSSYKKPSNDYVYNSPVVTDISVSSLLRLLGEILIHPDYNDAKTLDYNMIWTSRRAGEMLAQLEADRYTAELKKKNRKHRYSPKKATEKWTDADIIIRRIMTSTALDTPRILRSWGVYLSPPLTLDENCQIKDSDYGFWHSFFLVNCECATKDELEEYYWLSAKKLYKNIVLLCAKCVVSNRTYFSIIEGECSEKTLESFIKGVVGIANDSNQRPLTILLLASTRAHVDLSDSFFEWAEQHEEDTIIIDESKDTIIKK